MRSMSLSSVSYAYTSAVDVLVDVSLDLGPGWHGLVGANGSGKTTLLSLIAGDLQPDSGTITTPGPVVRCAQVVDIPTAEVVSLARSNDSAAYALRGRLDLEPKMVERWDTLSPGERRRWQVAAALAAEPSVLLLDEPTNHLDQEATRLLLSMLRPFQGIGLVVSHDRRVLADLTSTTLRVKAGSVTMWNAPYETARVEWEREEAGHRQRREAATAESRALKRRLDDQRRALETKSAQWARSQRYAKPGDHDTTSTARTNRFRSGQAAAGKRLTGTREDLERADVKRRGLAVERDHRGKIIFEGDPAPRQTLLEFRGDLEVAGTVLVSGLDIAIERTSRLRVAGLNGSGKTTLLQRLVEAWDLPSERLFYLPQDLTVAETERVLAEVLARPGAELGKTMQLFARLGGEPDDVLVSVRPSPGELRKLLLADALARNVWCLILDEPTNHFDLETVEVLEEALAAFPGALVVVSHDDVFTSRVTDETLPL
jgi:ATPase subunit of ABC transporter with duplicated ATPase domains